MRAPSGGRRTSPRPTGGTPTRSSRRLASPMAVRATESASDEPRGLGLVDLPPLKPRVLAVRTIPRVDEQLAAEWKLPEGLRAAGLITCTSDDALFVALDEGTKAAPVEVVYARSFYAGSSYPSGPLSGEAIGVYAARDPDEVRAALDACVRTLEREAWFYAADERGELAFFPHVVRATGTLAVARGGHRRRCADGVSHRAAARVDGGARRGAQGGVGARGQVVRSADGDELRRRLSRRRSAGLRGGGARVRRGRRRHRAGADRCVARGARRRRGAGRAAARRQGRGQLSRAGDGRAAQRQARAPHASARRRVARRQVASAAAAARQARHAAGAPARGAVRRRRRRRARARRRARRGARAGARDCRRRGDRAAAAVVEAGGARRRPSCATTRTTRTSCTACPSCFRRCDRGRWWRALYTARAYAREAELALYRAFPSATSGSTEPATIARI